MLETSHLIFASLVHRTSDACDTLCRKSKLVPTGLRPLHLSHKVSPRDRRCVLPRLKIPRDIIRKASAPCFVFGARSPSGPRSPRFAFSFDSPTSEVSEYSPSGSSAPSPLCVPPSPAALEAMEPQNADVPEELAYNKDVDVDASWDLKCCSGKRKSRSGTQIDEEDDVEEEDMEMQSNILAILDGLLFPQDPAASDVAEQGSAADTSDIDPHGPHSSRAVDVVTPRTVVVKDADASAMLFESETMQTIPVAKLSKSLPAPLPACRQDIFDDGFEDYKATCEDKGSYSSSLPCNLDSSRHEDELFLLNAL